MQFHQDNEIERARRLVAGADRAKENVEKVRKIIEQFYGLRAEYGAWYEDLKPPAVEIRLLSPTGEQVAEFQLNWDFDGYVVPNNFVVKKQGVSGAAQVVTAIRKLAPKDHQFCSYG
jgi:hypothetical protein